MLYGDFDWDELQLFHQCNPKSKPDTAVNLADAVTTTERPILLLVSGKIINENEECSENTVFGAFIANTARDGTEIQAKGQVDWHSTLLFQLSPVHDVFWGNLGRAGWEVIGEGLSFGNKDSGVALVLGKNLRRATLMQSMDRKEGVYDATEWRGSWSLQVEVEGIEIWGYE